MKTPNSDDLIAYLYDEADDPTREAVARHLDRCDETRSQLENWRSTMELLDSWAVDEPRSRSMSIFLHRATPLLKLAAIIVILLGLGFAAGHRWPSTGESRLAMNAPNTDPAGAMSLSTEATTTSEIDVERLVEQRLEARLVEWRAQQAEIERNLILASGAVIHRQIQAYVGEALERLKANAARNEALALFLPAEEQMAYQEKRAKWESTATEVARETHRTDQFTRQIIERARARTLPVH